MSWHTGRMPLLTIELMEGHGPKVYKALIERCTSLYATTLDAPIENFRTIIHPVPAACWGLGGVVGAKKVSPLITIEMVSGRPGSLQLRLMGEMSALVAEILGCELDDVRALIRDFSSSSWTVGGAPAVAGRFDEVRARAAAAAAAD